jgi:peroxiredoxin
MQRWLGSALLTLVLTAQAVAKEGDELLGKPAPPLAPVAWAQGELTERDLRGKVVLVRWWTEGCSLCKNTAPALNRLQTDFDGRGLAVVGVFHPKPPRAVGAETVLQAARELGFRFPVAVDEQWTLLHRWWLDTGDRSFTSVSFVLDRSGRIRYIHPGGEFFPSERPEHARANRDYREIRSLIQRLVSEK